MSFSISFFLAIVSVIWSSTVRTLTSKCLLLLIIRFKSPPVVKEWSRTFFLPLFLSYFSLLFFPILLELHSVLVSHKVSQQILTLFSCECPLFPSIHSSAYFGTQKPEKEVMRSFKIEYYKRINTKLGEHVHHVNFYVHEFFEPIHHSSRG